MGLFDLFRKPKPTVPLEQLSYGVAYFILPHYAFNDVAKVADMCMNMPNVAGPFFYLMACQAREVEPNMDDAKRYHWHHGTLDDGREYFVLEYPTPTPVDMSDLPEEQWMSQANRIVLAPYFSAIVRGSAGEEPGYFVLGQAPMGGGTTFRCVLREGANCNLGPGPAPELNAFLDCIGARKSS